MIKEIVLPNIGEGVKSAEVSEILVKPGDSISKNVPILVLESDKATMEIPSDCTGKIIEIFIKVGEQITPGQKLISIETSENTKPYTMEQQSTKKTEDKQEVADSEIVDKQKERLTLAQEPTVEAIQTVAIPFASPSIRRFARELGVNLNLVQGSGKKGRITKADVQTFVKNQLSGTAIKLPANQLEQDFSKWGEIETVQLNKIRRITGERMTTAWQTAPQVTHFDKVNITELDKLRQSLQKVNSKEKTKITLLPFLMKACVLALMEFPDVNSSLSQPGNELILKKYYHIRIAIDTPSGLIAPVIRNVDQKNIFEISNELFDISTRARNKQILPDELAGGTFTISSLGGIGGTYFTPIINPPEVAILGVSRAQMEQVHNGKTFENNIMLPLTLSYDHRVIDGALAARFMKFLSSLLSDLSKLSEANIL